MSCFNNASFLLWIWEHKRNGFLSHYSRVTLFLTKVMDVLSWSSCRLTSPLYSGSWFLLEVWTAALDTIVNWRLFSVLCDFFWQWWAHKRIQWPWATSRWGRLGGHVVTRSKPFGRYMFQIILETIYKSLEKQNSILQTHSPCSGKSVNWIPKTTPNRMRWRFILFLSCLFLKASHREREQWRNSHPMSSSAKNLAVQTCQSVMLDLAAVNKG